MVGTSYDFLSLRYLPSLSPSSSSSPTSPLANGEGKGEKERKGEEKGGARKKRKRFLCPSVLAELTEVKTPKEIQTFRQIFLVPPYVPLIDHFRCVSGENGGKN